jgi:predicted PurR-regulated permease PerM
MDANESHEGNGKLHNTALHTLTAVTVASLMVLFFLLVWYTASLLALVFMGILLAIFLRALSDQISSRTKIPQSGSLVIVILSFLILIALVVFFYLPELSEQVDSLRKEIPKAAGQLTNTLQDYEWGRKLVDEIGNQGFGETMGGIFRNLTYWFSNTLSLLSGFVVILFVAIYIAYDADLYMRGMVRLAPPAYRNQTEELLHTLGSTLRMWLVGRLISMTLVGVLVFAGLWALGIKLALPLGIIAGLLDFVPYIGPLLSAIPGMLLAATQGWTQVLYVALLFLLVQQIESYLVTPLVQQRAVSLPPVLTLAFQIAMGLLMGFVGIVIATPLAAVVLVLVKKLYIVDILDDDISVQG